MKTNINLQNLKVDPSQHEKHHFLFSTINGFHRFYRVYSQSVEYN